MEIKYICGIIEESLMNTSILKEIKNYLIKTRIENRGNENPPEWHVNEYHIPKIEFQKIIPELEKQMKKEWYIHAFNLDEIN